jgi:TATA-box binding protein (TBP) (component of TFIID and TFIIIB)
MEGLRVSTMTACAEITSNIDLANMYLQTSIDDFIKYAEHGDNNYKGYAKKNDKKKRKEKVKRTFFNQLTLHCFYDNKIINIKFFNNGRIQMTGLKYEEQGMKLLNEKLMPMFKNFKDIFDSDTHTVRKYRIVMMNSDFAINNEIDRDTLQDTITENGYYSTFEPDWYPGVNIKYYFNTNNDNTGICKCSTVCKGKGTGDGEGECKGVTIAVFKKGKILITGAKSKDQLITCKRFIEQFVIDDKKPSIKT